MQAFKKILIDSFQLIMNIIFFSIHTLRKIILPGKHTSGNLLSTIFILFLGISERILIFEKNISTGKKLLQHRYCKKVFVIAASLLFLLTSVEWAEATVNDWHTESYAQADINISSRSFQFATPYSAVFVSGGVLCRKIKCANHKIVIGPHPKTASEIYLFIRNIRV